MMDSPRKEKMDLSLPNTATDTLCTLVRNVLDELTARQWANLESSSAKKAIMYLCVNIIDSLCFFICEAVKKHEADLRRSSSTSSRRSSGGDGSLSNIIISPEEVYECLGNTISHTFAKVTGVPEDICCESTEEMTELMAREVTERVNSRLSKGSLGESSGDSSEAELLRSKSSKTRLRAIVKQMVRLLQKVPRSCKWPKKPKWLKRNKVSDSSMVADEGMTTVDMPSLTPVTPLLEDRPEEVPPADGFKCRITEAVKTILEEQLKHASVINNRDDISEEEYDLIVASTSRDTDKVVSLIVETIMVELRLDGTPEMEPDRASRISCWKRLRSLTKAFFVHRFAKESILSLVAKLRSELGKSNSFPKTEEELSMKLLIEAVDCFVEDMIPPEEDQERRKGTGEECLYRRIARDISSCQHQNIIKGLTDVTVNHLKPGKLDRPHFLVDIHVEMDTFVHKVMWDWLNEQAEEHEEKRDLVSVTLRKIHRAVLPSLPDDPLDEPVSDRAEEREICATLVTELMNRLLKKHPVTVSFDVPSAIDILTEMLFAEVAGSDIAVELSADRIKNIVKAAHKDLCKKLGKRMVALSSLLIEQPEILSYITETLKRNLLAPEEKSAIGRFFEASLRFLAQPYKCCDCTMPLFIF